MIISAKNREKSFASPIQLNYHKLINDFDNFDDVFNPEVEELESKFLQH